MNEETLRVINSTHTGTLATLIEDGAPYSTPITYTFTDGTFSWKSAPDAVHSKNIARDGRVSLSIFEPTEKPSAVYVNTTASAVGEPFVDEQWHQTLQTYEFSLGEYDEDHSTPGRLYYNGGKS